MVTRMWNRNLHALLVMAYISITSWENKAKEMSIPYDSAILLLNMNSIFLGLQHSHKHQETHMRMLIATVFMIPKIRK